MNSQMPLSYYPTNSEAEQYLQYEINSVKITRTDALALAKKSGASLRELEGSAFECQDCVASYECPGLKVSYI